MERTEKIKNTLFDMMSKISNARDS